MISYSEALENTLAAIRPLPSIEVELVELVGKVTAEPVRADIESPSIDVSLKDGFAIRSEDIHLATEQNPVRLRLLGRAAAGEAWAGQLAAGHAVRVLTGAPIPDGATAVLAEEFARLEGNEVLALADAEPGRNIMPCGADVSLGQVLVEAGEVLGPETIGLLAAAGCQRVPVVRCIRVGILATGDEVVAPGKALGKNQLYASNLVALSAWCHQYGMQVSSAISRDDADQLQSTLESLFTEHDAVLTSGGAWKGDRDLIVEVLERMGWRKVYHRVRIGPGKAVGFGILGEKPVFCLPGGPPSNQMAFLQLALPGLLKMGGHAQPFLPTIPVRLGNDLQGQIDWTQFVYGALSRNEGMLEFEKVDLKSRLQMMALATAIVSIPEGCGYMERGTICEAQLLSHPLSGAGSTPGKP